MIASSKSMRELCALRALGSAPAPRPRPAVPQVFIAIHAFPAAPPPRLRPPATAAPPASAAAGALFQLYRRAGLLQAPLECFALLAWHVLDDRARHSAEQQLRLLEPDPVGRAHLPDNGHRPVAHLRDHHVHLVTAAAGGEPACAQPDERAHENDEGPRDGGPSVTPLNQASYFSSTAAPASSSSPFSFSPSSRSMPSLTGLGASSTSALASLRPRPVAARTTLITWIFLSPAPVRTTSTVEDSSSAAP